MPVLSSDGEVLLTVILVSEDFANSVGHSSKYLPSHYCLHWKRVSFVPSHGFKDPVNGWKTSPVPLTTPAILFIK